MISIIIPTMNRPDFVIRTLGYYADTGFAGEILLGDSSAPEHAARIRAFVESMKDRLRVAYVACPGMTDRATLHRLAARVETRYVALIGDDDFLVTPGLQACADFLDGNADFVGANGLAWAFTVRPAKAGDSEVYGDIDVFDAYPQPEFLQASAAERYAAYMADYQATLFTLHRAEAWRDMWRDVTALEDRTFGAELLPSVLSPVLGRIKRLDRMYLLRQAHGRRYLLPEGGDWTGQPGWRANYEQFRELVLQRLRARDARPAEELRVFFEDAFQRGYLRRFHRAGGAAAPPSASAPGWLRRLAESMPGWRVLGSAYRAIGNRAGLARQQEVAAGAFVSPLQEWLRPGSAHFAAFQPVHRAISGPPLREQCG